MGQEGYVRWFSTDETKASQSVLLAMLRSCCGPMVMGVIRITNPISEWDKFQGEISNDDDSHTNQLCDSSSRTEVLGKNMMAEDAASGFRDGTCVLYLCDTSPLGTKLEQAILRDIPKELLQGFIPASPSVTIGPHDIWESSESERGHLFGRATFSFALTGYGTPADWNEFRRRIFLVPEIIELQTKIEAIIGTVRRCVYWNV